MWSVRGIMREAWLRMLSRSASRECVIWYIRKISLHQKRIHPSPPIRIQCKITTIASKINFVWSIEKSHQKRICCVWHCWKVCICSFNPTKYSQFYIYTLPEVHITPWQKQEPPSFTFVEEHIMPGTLVLQTFHLLQHCSFIWEQESWYESWMNIGHGGWQCYEK